MIYAIKSQISNSLLVCVYQF